MPMLRACGLFSGIGGFEAGLSKAGFETVLLCENDVSARAVLKRRFADVKLIGDITELKSLPNCDLVTAGWPCQDLSQAGQTSGLDGRNSVLVREIFRLLQANRAFAGSSTRIGNTTTFYGPNGAYQGSDIDCRYHHPVDYLRPRNQTRPAKFHDASKM
jgi:C-5 cytosine-specific DNA methylase